MFQWWVCIGFLAMFGSLRAEDTQADGDMMKRYLLGQVARAEERWAADYEARTSPEQIAAYQKQQRARLWEVLGGEPKPVSLNAQITGTVHRKGYRVEKLIYESLPGFKVSGLRILPDAERFRPPYPGVAVPVGHSGNGKAYECYQSMGALLALNGMAGLVFDAIDESERIQYCNEREPYVFDKNWGSQLHGTYGHQMIGIGSILLGRNTAWFEIADTMRAIDYLQSRPEVDPARIGCTGSSGGGIVTAYMVALDDRVKAAAPSCYAEHLPAVLRTIGPQDAEHHTWASMTDGPQPIDFLMLRAPVPTLLLAATRDFFDIGGAWTSYRAAKRLYTRLGHSERIGMLENDAPHNYNRLQREGACRWMARWLAGRDEPVVEPPIELLDKQEAQCTPEGQVMRLPGARSAYDINEDYERELAPRRAKLWAETDRAELFERVRRLAGIRKQDQLPSPTIERGEAVEHRAGYRIESLSLKPEEGVVLPALLYEPEKTPVQRIVLYVHEGGKGADGFHGGKIEQLTLGGARVLAIDLRGTGQTQQTKQTKWAMIGTDWQDVTTAYVLGRSYVGMRAEDVLTAARFALQELGAGSARTVDLIAVGNVGVPALHAAALEPALFGSVTLSQTLVSWADVIHCRLTLNQYINVVQGALLEYDLPNLADTLGNKLTVQEPRNAVGKPVGDR